MGYIIHNPADSPAQLAKKLNTNFAQRQQAPQQQAASDPGKPGPPGNDGINGRDGKDGKDGDPGKDGRNGIDGKDGERGKEGEPGRDGIDGNDGLPGKDGRDGVNGVDGKDGKDGDPGIDGKDGINGTNGVDGKDGKDGAPGLPGKDGPPGPPGEDGKDGDPGPPGKDGDAGTIGANAITDTMIGNRTLDAITNTTSRPATTGITNTLTTLLTRVAGWISWLQYKFHATGGHTHSGATDQGPKISFNNLTNVPDSVSFTPGEFPEGPVETIWNPGDAPSGNLGPWAMTKAGRVLLTTSRTTATTADGEILVRINGVQVAVHPAPSGIATIFTSSYQVKAGDSFSLYLQRPGGSLSAVNFNRFSITFYPYLGSGISVPGVMSVIEEGIVSGWRYKKWSNGEYEATQDSASLTGRTTTAAGNCFVYNENQPAAPVNMLSPIFLLPDLLSSSVAGCWITSQGANNVSFCIFSHVSRSNMTVKYRYRVTGTWK